MVLKGFSSKEWRRVLSEDAEEEKILQPHLSNLKINHQKKLEEEKDRQKKLEEEKDAEVILQSLANLKINNQEECGWWDVFMEEILPRLPANQLQKLRIVCKNWYRIIWSPYFVRLHLNVYNQSRIRVLMKQNNGMMTEYTYKINGDKESKLQIRNPPAIGKSAYIILGTCDGLLCLQLDHSIAVYNPSTGKCFIVETSYKLLKWSWFGRHPSSGEYLLVILNSKRKLGVYKFTKSKIKLIHLTSRRINPQFSSDSNDCRGTLLHGAVHWPAQLLVHLVSQPRQVIYAYHLDDNKYLEISPPVQCDFKLGVVEGCLFAILKPTADAEFEMWIMKEYGVHQSWTKYANIHGFNIYNELSPLGFSPNGDLILDVDKQMLIKYSFNDNKAELLNHRKFGKAIMCAGSLVSPTIVGT